MPPFPVPGVHARRVLVLGVSGSGKSTLARRLAAVTALPYVDVDALMWLPGWVEVPKPEKRERMAGVVAREEWVLDACYGWMSPVILRRADLVIGLDLAWPTVRRRLAWRTLTAALDRREMCNGNRETLRSFWTEDGILRWQKDSFAPTRERMRLWAAGVPTHEGVTPPPTLLLASPAQVHRYVRYVESRHA